MNKKLLYILLAIIIALALVYTFAFSSVTTGRAITNCENPETLDRYDCQLFEKELTDQCGKEFFKAGCS
jgi:hypothetical protein